VAFVREGAAVDLSCLERSDQIVVCHTR
jgi:hypothetical protein